MAGFERGSQMLKATALPTEPQPLPIDEMLFVLPVNKIRYLFLNWSPLLTIYNEYMAAASMASPSRRFGLRDDIF